MVMAITMLMMPAVVGASGRAVVAAPPWPTTCSSPDPVAAIVRPICVFVTSCQFYVTRNIQSFYIAVVLHNVEFSDHVEARSPSCQSAATV